MQLGPASLVPQVYANMQQLPTYSSSSSYVQDMDYSLFPQTNATEFLNQSAPSLNVNPANFDWNSFLDSLTQN
ncbi:hypothetical protein GYMLUDRAFT_47250 [Collybiopsis luxurians FD-317 M1]|uniref:Uncharacterized protein n=1 Tax=Collybiopsis luxurians FD-317 M1 TaxID=944289 RepID=A0A0D0BMR0_9AGAR|nr:hypothetical protein GYMLUDRAFT_47250 [Collybiopsis luxurians FD-317 M1]